MDRIFGSLASSSSSSLSPCANLSSLWSLTDDEVEKREWNREKDIPETEVTSYSSNLDGLFAKKRSSVGFGKQLEQDLEDLDDDDFEGETRVRGSSSRPVKPDDYNHEEWEIRSSIGLDCALDNEEEEDEYDKVAVGREKAGERLYMTDFNDYAIELDSCNVIPESFKDVARDPRANHMAAKIRLQEDAEAAGSFDSLRVSDKTLPAAAATQINTSEDGANLKSILKRKENQLDSKLHKRVRFDPGCKTDSKEEESERTKNLTMETCSMEEATVSEKVSFTPQDPSGVPDYIRNPTKYTHYTFDSSSDIDEESNRCAYMDFLNMLKKPDALESQADKAFDLPKAVTFTPRKKSADTYMMKHSSEFPQKQEDVGKEFMHRKGLPLGIAAEDCQETEVCAMDEDEPEPVASKISTSLQKPGRQYRTKASSELEESSS